MQEINVEQIMQEIRDDVAKKGMDKVPLQFADVCLVDNKLELPEKLDAETMKKEIIALHALWDTTEAIETRSTNKVKLAVKKLLTKMVMVVMKSNIIAQTVFNFSVVNIMGQVNCLVEENGRMKQQLEELQKEVESLKAKM